jgi:hypothetical protein
MALNITLWTLKKCCQKFDIWYNLTSTRICYILPMMDIPSISRWVKQVSPIKHMSLRPSRPKMCNLVVLVTPNMLFLGLILCLSMAHIFHWLSYAPQNHLHIINNSVSVESCFSLTSLSEMQQNLGLRT